MIGIEAVGMQLPPLRTAVVDLDPRFLGDSVALGGAGVFARYRPVPLVGFDVGVHSGSVRYRDRDDDQNVSQDVVMAEAGVLLYLARGELGQFALDGGLGGAWNRVGFDLGELEGTQQFGTGFVRGGVNAEFLVKRVAFILSLRTYGVFTDRDAVRNKGELMDRVNEEARKAPVATLQTYVVASVGVAYRF